MNKTTIFTIFTIFLLSSCMVKIGYVWEKRFEPYEEYTKVEENDIYDQVLTGSYTDEDGITHYVYTDVYSHTVYKKYLVQDFEDYIIVVKSKKNNDRTTYYVNKETYEELGIEATFDHDIHGGKLWDENNRKTLIDSWRI